MTYEEMKAEPRTTFRAQDIAALLGVDYPMLIYVAKSDPARFRRDYGFPAIVSGNRVKIPKAPFIRFWEGESVK